MSRVRPQTLLYEEQPTRRSVGAMQVHALVRNLQVIAKTAGHERPLMIGFDQEKMVRLFAGQQDLLNGICRRSRLGL
jgi:hypothetical protein